MAYNCREFENWVFPKANWQSFFFDSFSHVIHQMVFLVQIGISLLFKVIGQTSWIGVSGCDKSNLLKMMCVMAFESLDRVIRCPLQISYLDSFSESTKIEANWRIVMSDERFDCEFCFLIVLFMISKNDSCSITHRLRWLLRKLLENTLMWTLWIWDETFNTKGDSNMTTWSDWEKEKLY
jgi:hypothetical protein